MDSPLIRPKGLKLGDTIGIFTPSSPGYRSNEGLFLNGVRNLERLGFNVKLGRLSTNRSSQGYRSAPPKERADELMELITDNEVRCVMSTIGGSNSASLIPYLDFDRIRQERKILCGFSDVTSLHLAFLHYAGLTTVYGPSAMCYFGEWPDGEPESSEWFLDATMRHRAGVREIVLPKRWSNHRRRWNNEDWKTQPRQWETNSGWETLIPGDIEAPILALNLNTLSSAAGTPYWPDLAGKILLLEDMETSLSIAERRLRQLSLIGVFEQIAGLIFSKSEVYNGEGAPFVYTDLIREVVGPRPYPIIANFDCGHTLPMISIPQCSRVRLTASGKTQVRFAFMEPGVVFAD